LQAREALFESAAVSAALGLGTGYGREMGD
jgi:hypothetical protein